MRIRLPFIAAVVLASAAFAAPAGAQPKVRVEVSAPPENAWTETPPAITSSGLLADGSMRDLLLNGFPARLHYRLERWTSGRWFDDLKASYEWDVIVKYDVLGKKYQTVRVVNRKVQSLGEFSSLDSAELSAEGPYFPGILLPKKGQRGYYNLLLDVETLSLSDLDEVERWLRGELKPAVSGKKNPGTAVGRGVRTLVVRLLGGEKRHYEARTGTFRP
jgi:hypothetical protein